MKKRVLGVILVGLLLLSTSFVFAQSDVQKEIGEAKYTDSPVIVKPNATLTKDSIEMKLSIINNTKKAIVINHLSGQKFDFELLDENNNILYRWSDNKAFTMALTSTTIEPGKTLEFSDTLSGETYADIRDKIIYLKAYITGTSDDFKIYNDGYEIKVK